MSARTLLKRIAVVGLPCVAAAGVAGYYKHTLSREFRVGLLRRAVGDQAGRSEAQTQPWVELCAEVPLFRHTLPALPFAILSGPTGTGTEAILRAALPHTTFGTRRCWYPVQICAE